MLSIKRKIASTNQTLDFYHRHIRIEWRLRTTVEYLASLLQIITTDFEHGIENSIVDQQTKNSKLNIIPQKMKT